MPNEQVTAIAALERTADRHDLQIDMISERLEKFERHTERLHGIEATLSANKHSVVEIKKQLNDILEAAAKFQKSASFNRRAGFSFAGALMAAALALATQPAILPSEEQMANTVTVEVSKND